MTKAPRYGVVCVGVVLVSDCEKTNWISHSLGTLRPSISGGVKTQRRAAFTERSAKYLLGPEEASSASVTFPAAST